MTDRANGSEQGTTNSVADRTGHCLECGAKIDAADVCCWLCRTVAGPGTPRDAALAAAAAPVRSPFQFGLSTLMLSITLLSVCLGVFALEPGVGILLFLAAIPPFVRTAC